MKRPKRLCIRCKKYKQVVLRCKKLAFDLLIKIALTQISIGQCKATNGHNSRKLKTRNIAFPRKRLFSVWIHFGSKAKSRFFVRNFLLCEQQTLLSHESACSVCGPSTARVHACKGTYLLTEGQRENSVLGTLRCTKNSPMFF